MSEMIIAAEIEAKIKANEAALKANEAELAKGRDLATFGILVRPWVKAIEEGTVDWDDLIPRLESALDVARRLRSEQT